MNSFNGIIYCDSKYCHFGKITNLNRIKLNPKNCLLLYNISADEIHLYTSI